MDLVVLTAALSSINSGLYSTGRILRSLSVNGSAPKLAGLMSRSGVPYGGVLLTGAVYLAGLVLNVFLAGQAFEIGLNFSALGIIGMWVMIMLSHAAMVRKSKRGELRRPRYRLPGAPFTNYLTIAFLAVVFGLSWFDVPAGRVLIYATPAVAALLAIGWLAARGRVRRLAAQRSVNHP
jgi:L-asparagine permease